MTMHRRWRRLGAFARFSFCTGLLASSLARDAEAISTNSPRGFAAQLREVQAAIDVGNQAYVHALIIRDPVAFGRLFTSDAVSMPSRAVLVRGRDDIVESMRRVFAQMLFEDGSLRTITTHLDGDTAVEIGSYHFTVTVAGNERELHGRYVAVWRRIETAWLIALDASQPDAPPS